MRNFKHISFLLIFVVCIFGNINAQKNSNKNEENRVKAERLFFSGLKEKTKEDYTAAVNNFNKANLFNPYRNVQLATYDIDGARSQDSRQGVSLLEISSCRQTLYCPGIIL